MIDKDIEILEKAVRKVIKQANIRTWELPHIENIQKEIDTLKRFKGIIP